MFKRFISLILCIIIFLNLSFCNYKRGQAFGGAFSIPAEILADAMYKLAITIGVTGVTYEFGEATGLWDASAELIDRTVFHRADFIDNYNKSLEESIVDNALDIIVGDSYNGIVINDYLLNQIALILHDAATSVNLDESIFEQAILLPDVESAIGSISSNSDKLGYRTSIINNGTLYPGALKDLCNSYMSSFVSDFNTYCLVNHTECAPLSPANSYYVIGQIVDSFDSYNLNGELSTHTTVYGNIYSDGVYMPFFTRTGTYGNTNVLPGRFLEDSQEYKFAKSYSQFTGFISDDDSRTRLIEALAKCLYADFLYSCFAVIVSQVENFSTGTLTTNVYIGCTVNSTYNTRTVYLGSNPDSLVRPYGFSYCSGINTSGRYYLWNQDTMVLEQYSNAELYGKSLDLSNKDISTSLMSTYSTDVDAKIKSFTDIIDDSVSAISQVVENAYVKMADLEKIKTDTIALTDSVATDVPSEKVDTADVPVSIANTIAAELDAADVIATDVTKPIPGNPDDPVLPIIPDAPDYNYAIEYAYEDIFPFCIPYDFYKIISSLIAEPVAPVLRVPTYSLNAKYGLEKKGEIVVDFSQFDDVVVVFRRLFLLFFCACLAMSTYKNVGGGKS